MMTTTWKEFREGLELTLEEEKAIAYEKSVANAAIEAREQKNLEGKQLFELRKAKAKATA
ncbi:MAG: hypothetical protein LBE35_00640 [Clostridiales bacterium]|jgi:hypothetical protein|nr:hypothetical protein [Clostridiales bacterium]